MGFDHDVGKNVGLGLGKDLEKAVSDLGDCGHSGTSEAATSRIIRRRNRRSGMSVQKNSTSVKRAAVVKTPGAAISIGQVPVAVPEPSSMALLGLGAAGIAAWRARRKSQAPAKSQAAVEA